MGKRKLSKRRRYAKAAGGCHSGNIRDVLTAKTTAKKRQAFKNRQLGKFGAASEVRKIDPGEYDGKTST